MTERRKFGRKNKGFIVNVKKYLPDGNQLTIECKSVNISPGGVFLLCDDLYHFDPGEIIEMTIWMNYSQAQNYSARVVRLIRVFAATDGESGSGFGLALLDRRH